MMRLPKKHQLFSILKAAASGNEKRVIVNEDAAVCEWIDRETKIHCFRLSERNKRTILEKAALAAQQRQPRSKAFLERLQKLCPELAGRFSLRENAISEAPFRLLVPPSSPLVSDSSHQIESFIVVSYCWHNDEWRPVERFKKGWWPISDRMMNMVRHNCGENEGIWIDQLCIDQQNQEEKNLAVSAMDQIYKSARQTYAVIEDIEIPQDLEVAAKKFVKLESQDPATAARLILKIASARWYSRAWCSYELKTTAYLAGRPPLLILGLESPSETIWQISALGFYPTIEAQGWIMRDKNRLPPDEEAKQVATYMHYLGFLDPVGGRGDRGVRGGDGTLPQPYPDISVESLHNMLELGCLFITDYILIMINTSGLDIIFNGTVETHDELHWVLSALALTAGDASVLTAAGRNFVLPVKDERITSWMHSFGSMDWTFSGRLPEDNSIQSFSEESVELDLLFLENEPLPPCTTAITHAEAFVKACYEIDCPTLSPYYTATTISITETRSRLALNVATILDLGLEWIRSAWQIFQTEMIAVDRRWSELPSDLTLWDPVQDHLLPYLLLSYPVDDTDQFREVLQPFFSFFLSGYVRGNTQNPMFVRTGPGKTDFGLLDPNSSSLNHAIPPIVKYAIPVSLRKASFQRTLRVWVLEELAPNGIVPTIGRPAMSYQINQAARLGGPVTRTLEQVNEHGNPDLVMVEIEPGNITDESWDELKASMTRINMHEWIVQQKGGDEALNMLNTSSGCWRLVDKAALFGCPEVKPTDGIVTRRVGQKIYGEAKLPPMATEEEEKLVEETLQKIQLADTVEDQSEVNDDGRKEETEDGMGEDQLYGTDDDAENQDEGKTSEIASKIAEQENEEKVVLQNRPGAGVVRLPHRQEIQGRSLTVLLGMG